MLRVAVHMEEAAAHRQRSEAVEAASRGAANAGANIGVAKAGGSRVGGEGAALGLELLALCRQLRLVLHERVYSAGPVAER